MNQVELLEGKMEALAKRVLQIENLLQERMEHSPDALAAQRLAQEIGFAAEVIMLPKCGRQRRRLARELKQRGWTSSRIARALRCCERTVERWTAA